MLVHMSAAVTLDVYVGRFAANLDEVGDRLDQCLSRGPRRPGAHHRPSSGPCLVQLDPAPLPRDPCTQSSDLTSLGVVGRRKRSMGVTQTVMN